MAPVIVTSQPRTIVITPNMLVGDENRRIVDNGELPKYAVGLFESNGPGPRKRKRLTHLTPEEKIMRRKLKNRVAAQTARDRKKARLETLEETVAKIHEQTKKLLDVNSQLLERTEALEKENEILRERLGLDISGSFTQEKRKELTTIKREFNEIVSAQNISTREKLQGDCSDDEGYAILTPYEGNDILVDDQNLTDASPCEASKCRSPEPAASGERLKEGPFPQQQEAVNPAKLIHLQAEQENVLSRNLSSTLVSSPPRKMIQISQSWLKNLKPSSLSNVALSTSLTKKEMPLDLRKQ